ncbi:MAG: extracellular solute-binding protein [Aggregatilineales bacterium]
MKQFFTWVIALCFLLVNGVSAQDLASVNPSGQRVVYWHGLAGRQVDLLNQFVEEFNATNEWGITVEAIAQPDLRAQMSTAILSGDLPNIVGGFQNDAKNYFLDGAAIDLLPYFNDPMWGFTAEEQADFNPNIIRANIFEEAPYNGAMLLFTNSFSGAVMSVNLDMLAEVGFDSAPETFQQFRDIACATKDLIGPNGEDIQGFAMNLDPNNFESFVASNGGNIFDPETDRYVFTSPEVLEMFQLMQDMYNEGCLYIPATFFGNTDDFAFGLTPMAVGSVVGVPFILNNIEQSGSGVDNWIMTSTPWSGDNRTMQLYSGGLIIIPSTPEQQLASWLFIKHLASTENQIRWSESTFFFPSRISAAEGISQDFYDAHPYYSHAVNLIFSGDVNIYRSPQNASYGVVRDLLATAISDVTVGRRDVAEVAAALEAEANRVHQESLTRQAEAGS